MGALEEGGKAVGGFIDAMRTQPMALMLGLMNLALLAFLFYYLSRITARTETTVHALFESNDKLYTQWGVVIKDQNALTEKVMHCLLPDDAIKLLTVPRPSYTPPAPAMPERPRGDLYIDPPKPHPGSTTEHDPTGLIIPIEPHRTSAPAGTEPKPAE